MKSKKLSKLLLAGISCAVVMGPGAQVTAATSIDQIADTTTPDQACKGKNSCRGKGGCKTNAHTCKGKNTCKGQGGCKSRPMDGMMLAKRVELL
ncbi:MAG: hypothetical protein JSR46_08360 [Verrucomicrobia bacterium]|nr:hypothetical protein [Verrucomicrobiota bacterium]